MDNEWYERLRRMENTKHVLHGSGCLRPSAELHTCPNGTHSAGSCPCRASPRTASSFAWIPTLLPQSRPLATAHVKCNTKTVHAEYIACGPARGVATAMLLQRAATELAVRAKSTIACQVVWACHRNSAFLNSSYLSSAAASHAPVIIGRVDAMMKAFVSGRPTSVGASSHGFTNS